MQELGRDAPTWDTIFIEAQDEPEWQQAAAFQMPLDLRKAMLAREVTMSDQARLKRNNISKVSGIGSC